ncbi:unnamed protein product, partial [Choristocarpus tenellus]
LQGHCCTDVCCSMICTPCMTCQVLGETEDRGSVVDRWSLNTHRPAFEQPWKFGLANYCEDCRHCERKK